MPPVAKLALIPESLRSQLDEKLRADGFGNLEETASWLFEHGVDLGKSRLGVYALRLKRAHEMDLGSALGLNDVGVVKLRLQCAAIAASAGGEDLFSLADQILAWAVEPIAESL